MYMHRATCLVRQVALDAVQDEVLPAVVALQVRPPVMSVVVGWMRWEGVGSVDGQWGDRIVVALQVFVSV